MKTFEIFDVMIQNKELLLESHIMEQFFSQ